MLTKRSPATANKIVTAIVLVLAIVLLSRILYFSTQSLPSFDGATNLQGAWSLAEGDGYRRTYSDREPFPHSIQTNLPYTLPAAVVIKFWGVGILQAQSVSIAYLLAFLGIAAFIVYRRFGALPAALSAILLCVTPGLLDYALDGYGEVPGLALALAALPLFPWHDGRKNRYARIFLAGVLLSLAYATKPVLAICTGSFGLIFSVYLLSDRGKPGRTRAYEILLLVAGCVLPVMGVELWKLLAIGSIDGYLAWWQEGLGEIAKQAGTRAGFKDTTGYLAKFLRHLSLLGKFYHMPEPLLLVWLVGPFLLSAGLLLRQRDWRRDGPLLCLLLAAAIYFTWWLIVTPTLKAYHRRIFDGSLMLNLAWVYVGGAYLLSLDTARTPVRRMLACAPIALCGILSALLYGAYLSPALKAGVDLSTKREFERAVSLLRKLPPDAKLFGLGWYSAPALSLFSDRPFEDFNNWPVSDIDRRRPVYVVLDTAAMQVHRQDMITGMYKAREMLPGASHYQIYEVSLDQIKDDASEIEPERLSDTADFAKSPYPFAWGLHPTRSSHGARWMTSDAFVALRYDGAPAVSFIAYAPEDGRYEKRGGVHVEVLVNGCRVGARKIKPGLAEVALRIPERCKPQTGQPATVRLTADNLVKSGTIQDDRALSIVLGRLGFSTLSLPATAPPDKTSPGVIFKARPNPVDLCQQPLTTVTLDLDVSAAQIPSYAVWVEAPSLPRKLWVSGVQPKTTLETGPWVRELTKFSLSDEKGTVVATSTVTSRDCSISE